MKPKAALGLAVLLVLGLGLSACSTAPAEPVTLDVWFHSAQGTEREVLSRQVADFNANHTDVQVKLGLVPEDTYGDHVTAAGKDGSLPCLLDLDGPNLAAYAESGLLVPLDPYVTPQVRQDLLPSILEQGSWEGKLYGVGTFDSGLGLWGNRAHLEAAGVRLPSGVHQAWTFDEFNQALDALKALPEVEYPLDLKLDYGVGEWFTYGFSPFVQAFGGDLVDRTSGKAAGTLNGPESDAALEWLAGLIESGYTRVPERADDFEARRAALSWVGHWMWPAYRDALGDDLVLLPAPEGPRAHVTGMGSWQWGITSNCQRPDAAGRFLNYLLEPEQIVRTTDANGAVPARRSAVTASSQYGPEGPLRLYAAQLEAGLGLPRPITPAYPVITSAFAQAVESILDGEEPAKALTVAAERIDAAKVATRKS